MKYVSPELSLSYILKAHRSFSSGVPEPVMSVASMNSCFLFQKIYVFVYLYINANTSICLYEFVFFPVQFLALFQTDILLWPIPRCPHPEINAAVLIFVKNPEDLINKYLKSRMILKSKQPRL